MFADDEELVRSGLRAMVSPASDIEVVGEAADGRTAVEAVRRFHPDVALLDIRMRTPDDGIRALRAIQTDRKSTRLNSSHVKISYAVFCLKKKNWLFRSDAGT